MTITFPEAHAMPLFCFTEDKRCTHAGSVPTFSHPQTLAKDRGPACSRDYYTRFLLETQQFPPRAGRGWMSCDDNKRAHEEVGRNEPQMGPKKRLYTHKISTGN